MRANEQQNCEVWPPTSDLEYIPGCMRFFSTKCTLHFKWSSGRVPECGSNWPLSMNMAGTARADGCSPINQIQIYPIRHDSSVIKRCLRSQGASTRRRLLINLLIGLVGTGMQQTRSTIVHGLIQMVCVPTPPSLLF